MTNCGVKVISKPSLEDWQLIEMTARMMGETYGQDSPPSWIGAVEFIAVHLGFTRVSLEDAFTELSSMELGYE